MVQSAVASYQAPRPLPRVVEPPPVEQLSGVAIVRALNNARPEGAALLFDRYERDVNRMVWRLLGADPDHDDVVQHIFCTIIGRITTVRDTDKLDQWVHAVTVNTVYAELRKRQVRRLFLASQPRELKWGDLTREVEVQDLLQHARRLLDRMPPRERKVFVLHHVEGHTLREVSDLCGFSLATAKRKLAAADRRFNKMIQREPSLAPLLRRPPRD
jgi:RNA polymerase sigma-70 factor (ECF subfamily)